MGFEIEDEEIDGGEQKRKMTCNELKEKCLERGVTYGVRSSTSLSVPLVVGPESHSR